MPPPPKSQKASANATPASFPRVDRDTQQQRDSQRRRILEQELSQEQGLLEQAKKELAAQESTRLGSERNYQLVLDRLEPYKKKVRLHEDNVSNLRRELANARWCYFGAHPSCTIEVTSEDEDKDNLPTS